MRIVQHIHVDIKRSGPIIFAKITSSFKKKKYDLSAIKVVK